MNPINLRRFNLDYISKNSLIVIIGMNNSGKSFVTKDILYNFVREPQDKINKEIEDNKKLSSEYTKKCKEFQKIKGIENSSFIIQKLNIELTFNNKNIYSFGCHGNRSTIRYLGVAKLSRLI